MRSLEFGQGSPDALSSSAPLGILSQHRDSSPVATSAFEPERATTLRQAPNGNMALFGLHRDTDGARSHGVADNDRAHRPPLPLLMERVRHHWKGHLLEGGGLPDW